MTGRIGLLWELQNLDLKEADLRQRLGNSAIIRVIQQIELDLANKQKELAAMREKERNLERRLRQKDLELASQKEEKVQLNTKLYSGQVNNSKELTQLQQKLDLVIEREDDLEDKILAIMYLQESIGDERKKIELKIKAVLEKLQREKELHEAEISEINFFLEEITPQREKIEQELEDRLLRVYRKLKQEIDYLPVAAVRGDLCLGCRIAIPINLVSQIVLNEQLRTCPNCGRILYYEGRK